MYFESKKRSGGGDMKSTDIHEKDDYAIIEFVDYTGMVIYLFAYDNIFEYMMFLL